ncbi:MAG: arginine--tRNA ligase, partial [Nitrospinaceae bacterium]
HSLANLLRWAGHDVTTEYYINDVGNQMNNLGRSTWLRYRELLGESVDFPEDLYQGEYIRDIARQVIAKDGDRHLQAEEEEALRFFRRITSDTILRGIREDLAAFRVEYDHWFSEQSLHDEGAVEEAIQWLREKDHVYDKDGAVWLRASAFQDEKDRVIIKQGGEKTYFCADIAYHKNKIDRGFDWILDLWGADHHGYVPRMNAVLEMMGYGKDRFEVLLVQFVTLKRGGEKVSMSTRSGEFVTLAEVVSEVGVDAARYFFMMRSADSHLDFDLELAKKETPENPVYYIQYAHARICNVFGTARDKGVSLPDPGAVALDSLEEEEEMALIKKILGFPEVIEKSAESLEVHRISFYLHDLAARFHAYYNRHRVVTDDLELTHARLVLLECLRRVFANGLSIIGVSAPEKM